MKILGSDKNKSFVDLFSNNSSISEGETRESFSASFFKNSLFGNVADATLAELNLNNNYAPNSGSILLNRSNLFTDPKVADAFFDKVDYIGAFKSSSTTDNWTLGWANFDPQNTMY